MPDSTLLLNLPEVDFQTRIIDRAQALGWWIHHDRPARKKNDEWSTAISGDAGFPDLVLVRKGRVIFAELKTEKGRLSKTQSGWLGALGISDPDPGDVEVYLWRPSDTSRIEQILA